MSSKKTMRVSVDELKSIVYNILVSNQVPCDHADIASDCFVEADACGVSTHGVVTLQGHINRILAGGYNLNPKLDVLKSSSAFAILDADNAIGSVSAALCMKHAMEKSKEAGIFTVLSRNCNTYGPAFYYSLLAAKKGLIGITFCNSPAAMPAWGGKEKLLGTNPFSIAVPCNANHPIIFDMATSKVAKSKINQARINNEKIPSDWALDENGYPTTDPVEAIKGLVLPMEGPKGYGLAMTVDILSGVLSGAAFLNNVGKFYTQENKCMNVGQTFIAIDPSLIYGESFCSVMDEYVDTVKKSKSLTSENVRVPGDNKMRIRQDSITNGITIDAELVESMKSMVAFK